LGPGNTNDKGNKLPIDLKIGNIVLLPEFGGQKVELKDGEYYLYRDNELLGVLEE
jgi:chaperonin GroES